MNRLRVRVGERVREYAINPPSDNVMLFIEDKIDSILDTEYHFGPYSLEPLGEYAYDIVVDGRKVGHAKAWNEKPKSDASSEPTLWQWLLLIVSAYLALM